MEVDELRALIEQQAALMVAVATGGPRIEHKDAEYRDRRRRIRTELRRLGLEDPNPFSDLWAWYGHWSQHFGASEGGYNARRGFIRDLYEPLLDALDRLAERKVGTELQPSLTGWAAVDHKVGQLRERYATARTTEDCQAIGLLCRDVFRALADATFEARFVPSGARTPGPADAVARLHFVVDAAAPGETHREVRRIVKANFDLANKVQHDQLATLVGATLVSEATITSVNLLRALVLGPSEIADEPEEDYDPRDEDYWDWRDR